MYSKQRCIFQGKQREMLWVDWKANYKCKELEMDCNLITDYWLHGRKVKDERDFKNCKCVSSSFRSCWLLGCRMANVSSFCSCESEFIYPTTGLDIFSDLFIITEPTSASSSDVVIVKIDIRCWDACSLCLYVEMKCEWMEKARDHERSGFLGLCVCLMAPFW